MKGSRRFRAGAEKENFGRVRKYFKRRRGVGGKEEKDESSQEIR